MNIFTITALVLASIFTPVIIGTISVIRQDIARARRDDAWLARQR